MATKQFNSRIQWKKDTSANWTQNNPVLLNGEIAIVVTNAGETRFKVGDGTSSYTALPFQDEFLQNEITNINNDLTAHEENTNNPHNVVSNQVSYTPTQGGVIQDVNVQDALETVEAGFTGLSTSLSAVASELRSHEGNTSNPHSVTKEQVGLGNVDNVKQYSTSNPPPYPVTSVNGSVGAVNLTASDVGALPTQTGTQGQFLGFTANNVIGAVDAPSNTSPFNTSYSGTLASGSGNWTSSGGQYYQQISLASMTSTQTPLVFPQWTTNIANEQTAWNNLTSIQSYNGYVRFYASAPTTTNVNFILLYTDYSGGA